MAEELDWVYYDSVSSGTAASAVKTFFAQSEAATNKQTTNMPVAGKLSPSEEFIVHEIAIYPETDILHSDLVKRYDRCVFEFLINNNRVLAGPTLLMAPAGFISWSKSTDTIGAISTFAGVKGGPFILNHPIVIPPGAPFAVKVTVGHAATGTAVDIKVALRGILRRR